MRNARLKSPVKILAVLAHPDDEAFGMGGTLAHYARHGAEVNLICATLGEAGVVEPGYLSNGQTVAELREQELRCSADALGLKEVILLGYRDSGMQGSPDNSHPNALAAQNLDDVVQKIEAHMRALQPDIVLTFDPFGGYGHPDHVRIHEAATLAFLKIRSEMPAEAALDPAITARVFDEIRRLNAAQESGEQLTPREREILQLLAEGHDNRTIAARLHLSEKTVGNRLSEIFLKLGVANRTQAAMVAVQRGLVAPAGDPGRS